MENKIFNEEGINLENYGLNKEILRNKDNFYIGRIVTQHRSYYRVITEKGEVIGKVSGKLIFELNNKEHFPAVGDWVYIDIVDGVNGVIHEILPRRTTLCRKVPGAKSDEQILATNIDKVFITMSLNNNFNVRRLERYINIGWDSGATPIILLTKADLALDSEEKIQEAQEVALGVEIITVSSFTGYGVEKVKEHINKTDTVVFIGSSGVGKSTLINKLLGEEVLLTKEVDEYDKGRHTTTHRELFLLHEGGIVIDTPGMRELQLSTGDLESTFADIEELATQCHFYDCSHKAEPHCAIKKAIEEGILEEERFKSYERLKREIKNGEIRRRAKERVKEKKHKR